MLLRYHSSLSIDSSNLSAIGMPVTLIYEAGTPASMKSSLVSFVAT